MLTFNTITHIWEEDTTLKVTNNHIVSIDHINNRRDTLLTSHHLAIKTTEHIKTDIEIGTTDGLAITTHIIEATHNNQP